MGRGSLNGEKCTSIIRSENSRAEGEASGENTADTPDNILYGEWAPGAEGHVFTQIKVDDLYGPESGYFEDSHGYSGTVDWAVLSPVLPEEWRRNRLGGVLEMLFVSLIRTHRTEKAVPVRLDWQHDTVCAVSDTGRKVHVKKAQVQAVELLAPAGGSWHLLSGSDDLLLLSEQKQILGTVSIP